MHQHGHRQKIPQHAADTLPYTRHRASYDPGSEKDAYWPFIVYTNDPLDFYARYSDVIFTSDALVEQEAPLIVNDQGRTTTTGEKYSTAATNVPSVPSAWTPLVLPSKRALAVLVDMPRVIVVGQQHTNHKDDSAAASPSSPPSLGRMPAWMFILRRQVEQRVIFYNIGLRPYLVLAYEVAPYKRHINSGSDSISSERIVISATDNLGGQDGHQSSAIESLLSWIDETNESVREWVHNQRRHHVHEQDEKYAYVTRVAGNRRVIWAHSAGWAKQWSLLTDVAVSRWSTIMYLNDDKQGTAITNLSRALQIYRASIENSSTSHDALNTWHGDGRMWRNVDANITNEWVQTINELMVAMALRKTAYDGSSQYSINMNRADWGRAAANLRGQTVAQEASFTPWRKHHPTVVRAHREVGIQLTRILSRRPFIIGDDNTPPFPHTSPTLNRLILWVPKMVQQINDDPNLLDNHGEDRRLWITTVVEARTPLYVPIVRGGGKWWTSAEGAKQYWTSSTDDKLVGGSGLEVGPEAEAQHTILVDLYDITPSDAGKLLEYIAAANNNRRSQTKSVLSTPPLSIVSRWDKLGKLALATTAATTTGAVIMWLGARAFGYQDTPFPM